MKKIPTVNKFFNQFGGYTREEMLVSAKEFAKLHVEKFAKLHNIENVKYIEEIK